MPQPASQQQRKVASTGPAFQESDGTEPNRRNRTEPLQRTARNRTVNRTVPLHMYCIPLHYRWHAGEYRCFGTCRPKPVLRSSTPKPAAQHPQPCLLLLRRSNECRFPSHTKTAHALYSPALPRARGGVQVFSTFRPQMFQNLYSPASAAQHHPTLLIASPKK